MMRNPKEKFKTYKDVFDEFTLRNLFKLSKNHFEELKSPISIGKEGNIFTAETKDGKKVIVKIYRLETCDFNRMYSYIKYDPRYSGLKKNKRKVIFAWAQREYRNLLKVREIGVRAPTPIVLKDNILVMELIGDAAPSPKLKDAIPKNPNKFYKKIAEYMKKMYKKGYVHADLSEFNILNYNESPVFIDFSQCTPIDAPNAKEFLERDIRNITRFFKKLIKVDEERLKKHIED